MKSKTLISSIIVITIVIGMVIMFSSESSDSDTPQQASAVDNNNATAEAKNTSVREPKKSVSTALVAEKPQPRLTNKSESKKSPRNTKKVSKLDDGSSNRVVRVSRPGQKYRMVRVETSNIPPKSELRKWTRSQWVTKVSSLQKAGQDSLAQEYISAYNTQYPDKDLNNYLK